MPPYDDYEDVEETPVPSSKSGKRFEELYRLKQVVSSSAIVRR